MVIWNGNARQGFLWNIIGPWKKQVACNVKTFHPSLVLELKTSFRKWYNGNDPITTVCMKIICVKSVGTRYGPAHIFQCNFIGTMLCGAQFSKQKLTKYGRIYLKINRNASKLDWCVDIAGNSDEIMAFLLNLLSTLENQFLERAHQYRHWILLKFRNLLFRYPGFIIATTTCFPACFLGHVGNQQIIFIIPPTLLFVASLALHGYDIINTLGRCNFPPSLRKSIS